MNGAFETHRQADENRPRTGKIVAQNAGDIAGRQRAMRDPFAENRLGSEVVRHVQRIEVTRDFRKTLNIILGNHMHGLVRHADVEVFIFVTGEFAHPTRAPDCFSAVWLHAAAQHVTI